MRPDFKSLALPVLRETELVDDTLPVLKSGSDWDTAQGSLAEVPVVDNSGDHLCTAGFQNLLQALDLK